jgi:hypothetical protein
MYPMGSSRRWWLNQDAHSRVASSTDSLVFQGARRWINSALYSPLMVSARALFHVQQEVGKFNFMENQGKVNSSFDSNLTGFQFALAAALAKGSTISWVC